ncbi:MAG TPA: aminotransferase class I/II-fold pyridoxal phosphate-dependent enzyme [Mycobacterium sp.]|nr:aminotransferase class I/II-fold pyridoxal phosphate-dependent enzyme [Mycobacterium sp.]
MTAVADARPRLPLAVDPLALALNENPYPPLPTVQSAIVASLHAANRYPEFLPERLRAVIATHIGVPEEQVILGAGATGVLMQVLQAITDRGDRIVIADPTFEGYPIVAAMNRLELVRIPLTASGHHDLAEMVAAGQTARVVVLCRPHNPTGTIEPGYAVEALLNSLPTDTVVVLDEAYVEFVAPSARINSPALVQRFPNVIVLRTFSKAYGLAGLRIGYGFGSPELAARLWAMQLPFGTSITSLLAVEASYRAEAQLRHRIRKITAERHVLRACLQAIGINSADGHANFLYLPAAGHCWREVFDGSGVRVKYCPGGGVRLSVGDRSSTEAVLAVLRARV